MPIWVLCDGKVLISRQAMHVTTERESVYEEPLSGWECRKGRKIIYIQLAHLKTCFFWLYCHTWQILWITWLCVLAWTHCHLEGVLVCVCMCGPVGVGTGSRAAMLTNPIGWQTAEAEAITTDKLSNADNGRCANTVCDIDMVWRGEHHVTTNWHKEKKHKCEIHMKGIFGGNKFPSPLILKRNILTFNAKRSWMTEVIEKIL